MFKIQLQHKKRIQAYALSVTQDSSAKYPSLKTLQDYPQSLKLKESLEYRLGEAFINACKFWWCGGLVYFTLQIPNIKASVRTHKKLEEFWQESKKILQEHKNLLKNSQTSVQLIKGALSDSSGIGLLELRLFNAYVPSKYYFIFYQMLRYKEKNPLVCIDGGAHKGKITDIILQCGGISYAFEPNIYLAGFLRQKYQNNPNVILYQNAIGDHNTKTLFAEYSIIGEGNRIADFGSPLVNKPYEVEVLDLTEVILQILEQTPRIYLLKLDVEGAEFGILDKIIKQKLWQKIDYIVCETHQRFFADGEAKIQNLKAEIEENSIDNILLDWI